MERSAFEVLEARWASHVLLVLRERQQRFNYMLGMIAGISDRMLTTRLRDLEVAGLVVRIVQPGPPVAVFYSLTHRGEVMVAAMAELTAL